MFTVLMNQEQPHTQTRLTSSDTNEGHKFDSTPDQRSLEDSIASLTPLTDLGARAVQATPQKKDTLCTSQYLSYWLPHECFFYDIRGIGLTQPSRSRILAPIEKSRSTGYHIDFPHFAQTS